MISGLWFTYPTGLSNPMRHLALAGEDNTVCGLPTRGWFFDAVTLHKTSTDLCHWCVSYMVGKVAP